jgi:lipoprotein-anchoring transpeptidase ErfK/SrfK
MFLRAVAVSALMIGFMGAPGEVLAQFYPGPPGAAPPPMRPLPPPATVDDADLPPYDPPPGYRRQQPAGSYGQPQRSYESEALPPPGPYAAPGGAAPNYQQGREPVYSPPPGQYGAAPGYPPGREPTYAPPPGQTYSPPRGQYGAAPGYPQEREPAYGPAPGYDPDYRGPAPRPQYGTVPPQQQDSGLRPPGGIGQPGVGQPGAGDPADTTSSLPMDVRPETGPRKELPPQFRRTTVEYRTREPAGTIVIDTQNTYLYLVLGGGKAIRYGIGVGREGFTWQGAERVSRMAEWPDWHPPSEMIERQPYLPRFMAGGEGNPLGARALYLGKTLYRIHGTNQPSTIGTFVSSGCIRLTNEDVTDLYYRVKVGTRVVVLPGKPPAQASAPAPAPSASAPPPGRAMPQGQQAENYNEPVPLYPPAVIQAR